VKRLAIALLFSVGCVPLKPPTPAEHTRNLGVQLKLTRVGCVVYTLDQRYPRDNSVTAQCAALLKVAP
jgi:hypothetical protein